MLAQILVGLVAVGSGVQAQAYPSSLGLNHGMDSPTRSEFGLPGTTQMDRVWGSKDKQEQLTEDSYQRAQHESNNEIHQNGLSASGKYQNAGEEEYADRNNYSNTKYNNKKEFQATPFSSSHSSEENYSHVSKSVQAPNFAHNMNINTRLEKKFESEFSSLFQKSSSRSSVQLEDVLKIIDYSVSANEVSQLISQVNSFARQNQVEIRGINQFNKVEYTVNQFMKREFRSVNFHSSNVQKYQKICLAIVQKCLGYQKQGLPIQINLYEYFGSQARSQETIIRKLLNSYFNIRSEIHFSQYGATSTLGSSANFGGALNLNSQLQQAQHLLQQSSMLKQQISSNQDYRKYEQTLSQTESSLSTLKQAYKQVYEAQSVESLRQVISSYQNTEYQQVQQFVKSVQSQIESYSKSSSSFQASKNQYVSNIFNSEVSQINQSIQSISSQISQTSETHTSSGLQSGCLTNSC